MRTKTDAPAQPPASFTTHPHARPLGVLDTPVDVPSRLAVEAAELHELRAELDRLRAERDRLLAQQRQLAELLGSKSPDKIVHDVRGVLNELQLTQTLLDVQAAKGLL